ncbi:MAG: futalosine hydrolase [bacterium]|nr:futalosine hydrolase [bacterium]
MSILILTATAFEQEALLQAIQQAHQETVATRKTTCGTLFGHPVRLLETGMGAVNTAHALTITLERERPTLVLQTGIGGAYLTSELNKGDIAIATSENYGDLGVLTPTGWQPAETIGIPVLQTDRAYYNTFPLNPNLVTQAETIVRNLHRDALAPTVLSGPFVTVQQCSGRTDTGNALAAQFNAICENMEGAAAAHLCALYNIPFLEVRGISNLVEDRNRDAWNIPLAIRRSQQATQAIIEHLELR